jgi:hypothetical protein
VLSRVHFDMNLKQALSRASVMKSASPDERKTASRMGSPVNLVSRTKDAESDKDWETQLVSQGWPPWVIRLHSLPALNKQSANFWFELGWNALGPVNTNA